MIVLIQLAITFAAISLVAIGGANAVVPEIHRRVVDVFGWMTDSTFATVFALSQVAPGPNVLIVSLVGWQVAGLAGLAVATLAMLLPSGVLALTVSRVLARHESSRTVKIIKTGLVPVTIGLIAASGLVMARASYTGIAALVITVGAVVFTVMTERNPLWALAGGAVIGAVVAL